MKRFILLNLVSAFTLLSFSAKAWDNKNAFEQKVFIENKGQYNGKNNLASSDIKYVIENNARIFFTPKGLTYQMAILEEKEETAGMKIEDRMEVSYSFIHMEWVGASPAVQIIAENKVPEYFTYPDNVNRKTITAYAYKKITYKNLYPNIDVEYVFHEKEGIKYNLVLHPGANPALIKMKYISTKKISADPQGNILLASITGDVIDHAPVTFYQDNRQPIKSAFSLNETTVSFKLEAYDNTKTVVIDPWTTNPAFTAQNKAFNVCKDPGGNIYSTGGTNPFYLKKFTPAGALIWTFTMPNATNWSVDNVVDPAGNSYLAYGAWQGNVNVKVNTAGAQVFNNTASQNGTQWSNGECYAYVYSCFNSKLYAGGFFYTGSQANQMVAAWEVNQTNGMHSNHQGPNPFIEIRSMRGDDQGNLYAMSLPVLTSNTAASNRLIKLSPALATLWSVQDGYMMTEAIQGYYQGYCCNGFNGVAVGCYVYCTDGLTLKKWDKTTGAQIGGGVNVPGGVIYSGCSGLHVDVCGNVYAGSTTGVYKYDQNLNQLGFFATTGAVYDIMDGNIPGEVIASGNGFISSINVNACTTVSITTTFTAPSTCGACDAVASVTSNACAVSYSWSTGATTPTIGGLCPGVYTASVIAGGCSGVATASTVTITGNNGFSITATPVHANCDSATGTITISTPTGVPTYTVLQNGVNVGNGVNFPYNLTGINPGNYTYLATAANGCTAMATASINFVNTLTVSATGTNVLCFGGNTGSASVTVLGGSGLYTYNWTNTSQTNANPVSLTANTYVVLVTDGACTRTTAVVITQPPALSLTINSSTTNVCAGTVINVNGLVNGGTGPYTYTWSPGPNTSAYNVSETVPGNYNYILNVTDNNGCPITNNVNLTFNPIPVIAATSQTVCYGDKAVLSANGAESYYWSPINYNGNTYTTTATQNLLLSVVGTNQSTGCSSLPVTASLVVNPLPLPQINHGPNTGCVPLCMTFTASNNGGAIQSTTWEMGDGSFASNVNNTDRCYTIAGEYTVKATVVDNNGCISSITSTLQAYPIPVADFNYAPLKPIVNNSEVTFTDASFNANVTKWDWYFMNLPKPYSPLQNPTYTYLDAGTYAIALRVTSDHGCVDTIVKTIIVGEDYGIYVPNIFTPNGDGLNDIFQPKGFGIVKYELRLFNRWGEELMHTNEFAQGWDGMYKGKLSKEDTYIWKINLTNVFGKSHELTGHVTLMK